MMKVHFLPNVITAFGLSCGLFVIFKMNMTPLNGATEEVLTVTCAILLLAALADLVDGAIARALKAESEFGGLFDSLADAITFGVGPPVMVLKSLSIEPGTEMSFFLTIGAMVYTVCGVLRLVRFNIMGHTERQDPIVGDAQKKNFTGLPIPAAAAATVSSNLFLVSQDAKLVFDLSETVREWTMFSIMLLLGYFMISRWKFPSFKSLHIRVASFQLVLSTVLLAVLIFYGILHHFPLVFLLVSWGYLLIAWSLSITRLIAGRKSKTLEDFEPDEEDPFNS